MIDMHTHSTNSDGMLEVNKLIDYASKINLDCVAISDHDILLEESFNSEKLNIIKAVEFGITYKYKEVHILGYFVDKSNEKLYELSKLAREDRSKRLDIFIEKFDKLNIKIDREKILSYSEDKIFSRSHLAQYLVDIGICKNKNDAFNDYLSYNGKCYVPKEFTSLQYIIDTIKSASGVCVLAHPVTLNDDKIVNEIIDMGIDGIEVVNSKHSFDDIIKYLNLAISRKILYTAGSDCHGREFDGKYLLGNFAINKSAFESIKTLHELRINSSRS